ncbi:hypothetical protein D3C78_1388090 [compost metagenome]
MLLIVVGDGLQQVLLLFAAGQSGLALHDVARTQKGDRADNGTWRAVAFFDDLRCVPGVCHYSGIQKGQNIARLIQRCHRVVIARDDDQMAARFL